MANDLQRLTKEEVHGVDVSTSLTIKDPTKSPTVSPTSNEVEGPTISPTWRDRKSESNFSVSTNNPENKKEQGIFTFVDVLSTNDLDPNEFALHTNVSICDDNLLNTQNNNKSETILIDMNPKSTIASDISEIRHYPSTKSICLHLQSGSRCPMPDLLGRLSGSSIAMLEWVQNHPDNNQAFDGGTVFCGSYANAWLMGGIYFLEILIIHCNGFGVIQKNISQMMQIDFGDVCIEDPKYSRVTGDCAFVNIEPNNPLKEDEFAGHWRLKHGVDSSPRPWFTRYQPLGCRDQEQIVQPNCSVPMHSGRAAEYSFRWKSNGFVERLQSFTRDLGFSTRVPPILRNQSYPPGVARYAVTDIEMELYGGYLLEGNFSNHTFPNPSYNPYEPKICLASDSHGEHLLYAFWRLGLGHLFVSAQSYHPLDLSVEFFEKYYHTRNCTQFVIGIGQWPAAYTSNFAKYARQMTERMTDSGIYSIGRGDIKVYLWQVHYNPIGDLKQCIPGTSRPEDFRNPTVIDGYNILLQNIADDFRIKHNSTNLGSRLKFLDTKSITYPLWDTAFDFCHFTSQISDVEALYMAAKLLLSC